MAVASKCHARTAVRNHRGAFTVKLSESSLPRETDKDLPTLAHLTYASRKLVYIPFIRDCHSTRRVK